MSDFEVMPPGSGRVLRQALQQLERGFAEQEPYCYVYEYDGASGLHRAFYPRLYNGRWADRTVPLYTVPRRPETAQQPVAWRFRTIGIEHAAWRLTDDAGLIAQMRKLGHWDIRPLGELADEGGGK